MNTTKTFDSTKFLNHKVRLRYDVERSIIRLICTKPDIAAKYLAGLIVEKKIGSVGTVIYSTATNSRVVALMRGEHLNRFLRSGEQKALPKPEKRKSFSEIAENGN